MRVLLVNKFFYPRGGDCLVAMATRQMLLSQGHEVRVFAMSHPENIPLPDCAGYATPVDFARGPREKLAGARRVMGLGDIRKSFAKVLDDFRPDVVHMHNVHSYLSPIVGEMAKARGARVVWTMHDFKLICPAYLCRRPDGSNCQDCIGGPLKVAVNRCMKGSRLQSLMADMEARVWNRRRLCSFTDCFISPSKFLANKMLEAGYPEGQLKVMCNFIDPEKLKTVARNPINEKRSDYFCYVGRLSEEKGVVTLLKAAADAGVRLKVAGAGPLMADLQKKYQSNPQISFLGHLDASKVVELLQNAQASVMPSECFENNPLGVIESLCCGTPVIGARIGGIPELIGEREGITFTSGNAEELANVLRSFPLRHAFPHEEIALRARERFSQARHYDELLSVYRK